MVEDKPYLDVSPNILLFKLNNSKHHIYVQLELEEEFVYADNILEKIIQIQKEKWDKGEEFCKKEKNLFKVDIVFFLISNKSLNFKYFERYHIERVRFIKEFYEKLYVGMKLYCGTEDVNLLKLVSFFFHVLGRPR
jgi:hypothetical protein